jgi:hypothetical protein
MRSRSACDQDVVIKIVGKTRTRIYYDLSPGLVSLVSLVSLRLRLTWEKLKFADGSGTPVLVSLFDECTFYGLR